MTEPMRLCPMAETCKTMMNRPRTGAAFMVPGVLFILLGVIVLIEPRILVWLVSIAFIFAGMAMLMFGWFMRKMGERF